MQADVDLDEQLGAERRGAASARASPSAGGDAVDGDGQLDAGGGELGEPLPLRLAERRVVDEDPGRAGLLEDLRLAGLRDGQPGGAELELAEADLGRLVRLRVRPELDPVRVGV